LPAEAALRARSGLPAEAAPRALSGLPAEAALRALSGLPAEARRARAGGRPTAPMNALAVAISYLLGSVPFAVVVSRALSQADPRTYGSGNPGATNVLRGAGRAAAALTLIGDIGKGALAVWLGRQAGGGGASVAILCGAAAFVGHVFPLFLRFRGGKGVATFLGVLLAYEPWLGLACGGLWLAVALATRYSSLASLAAAAGAPVLLGIADGVGAPLAVMLAMSALLIWRHRSNIAKLRAGTESRIGSRGNSPQ
jgi:glycerol-3-phosphate acyltransferase PlsY